MSEEKVLAAEMNEDEPEEGEIQDDDGSLEDVSSDEEMSTSRKKICERGTYDNKYIISQFPKVDYITHSSLPHNSRVSVKCEYKERHSSTAVEDSHPRLNFSKVSKYREDGEVPSCESYTSRGKMDVGSERRKDDHFHDVLNDYKSVRPRQNKKNEDTVQEKENRHDARRELKVKIKCKRKRRHSVLENPESRCSLPGDIKSVGTRSKKTDIREDEKKKKVSFSKSETRCKNVSSKKRTVSPKREKHRCSKKKERKKLCSKLTNLAKNDNINTEDKGNSLLKRLQAMMAVKNETVITDSIKEKIEDNIKDCEVGHSVKETLVPAISPDHLSKSCIEEIHNDGVVIEGSKNEIAILEGTNESHTTEVSSLTSGTLPEVEMSHPEVIIIDDSDSEPQVSDRIKNTAITQDKGDLKTTSENKLVKGINLEQEDEDLVQLRLNALQSNRRKQVAEPKVDEGITELHLAVVTIDDSDNEPQVSDNIKNSTVAQEKVELKTANENKVVKETDDEEEDEEKEDDDIVQLRLNALQSNRRKQVSKPKIEDEEVMQLRLAALKSAILKKYAVRKQRSGSSKLNSDACDTQVSSALGSSVHTEDNVKETNVDHENPDTAFMEPDETTTLVDMDLSNTDDERESDSTVQQIESFSADIPLPGETINTHTLLQPVDTNYSTQNIIYSAEFVPSVPSDKATDLIQKQMVDDTVSTWNPSVLYPNPEQTNFDVGSCQASGVYNNNVQFPSLHSVGYHNFSPSFPQQQQMYGDFYENSNNAELPKDFYENSNNAELPKSDLDGVSLDVVDSSLPPVVPCSFVSSNINSPVFVSDGFNAPGMDTNVYEAKSFDAELKSQVFEVVNTSSTIQPQISPTVESQDPNPNSNFRTKPYTSAKRFTTRRTLQPIPRSVTNPVLRSDCIATSYQISNNDGNVENSKSSLVTHNPPLSPVKCPNVTETITDSVPVPADFVSSSRDFPNQELAKENVKMLNVSPDVHDETPEVVGNKPQLDVEEHPHEENIDMSEMIVLDEIGLCSSPEAKTEDSTAISLQKDQSLGSLGSDEVLKAELLTTLAIKPSKSIACSESTSESASNISHSLLSSSNQRTTNKSDKSSKTALDSFSRAPLPSVSKISPKNVKHPSGTSIKETSANSHQLKRDPKISPKSHNKKFDYSHKTGKGNISGKVWKKSLKKGVVGTNPKQVLTKLNKNSESVNQLKKNLNVFHQNVQTSAAGSKASIAFHKTAVTKQRVVFGPRILKPTNLQVTVPATSVDDGCRRTVAESDTSSLASVHPKQRFVIRLGEDSDSADEEDKGQQLFQASERRYVYKNNVSTSRTFLPASASVTHASLQKSHLENGTSWPLRTTDSLYNKIDNASVLKSSDSGSQISVDFEKSVDMFLKEVRKSQEAKTATGKQKTVTPAGRKIGASISSVTPLAVRHLPSYQQEEYRRLKQQIAELEEQKKLRQLKMVTKPSSLPSSPSRSALSATSIKSPLKIVVTNPDAEKKEVTQNRLITVKFENDTRQIFRNSKVENKGTNNQDLSTTSGSNSSPRSRAVNSSIRPSTPPVAPKIVRSSVNENKDSPIVSSALMQPKVTEGDNRKVVRTAPSLVHRKQPRAVSSINSNMESIEEKQTKLADAELQLLSKRDEVLDNLTNLTTLLQQVEVERATANEYLAEVKRLRSALCQAEEKFNQQRELLKNVRSNIAGSYQQVVKGRTECFNLSKTCRSLGTCLKGQTYKVPPGGAELMNLKLKQFAAQTKRISKNKDMKSNHENSSGNGDSPLINLDLSQNKRETKVLCNKDNDTEDTLINSNKLCASPISSKDMERNSPFMEEICIPYTENASIVIPKTDVSLPEAVNFTETLPEQSVVQCQGESDMCVASKPDNYILVGDEGSEIPSYNNTDTSKCQNSVEDVKRISTGAVEECSEQCEMVMGMDSNLQITLPRHITEYKSPLEHIRSKRNYSQSGNDWCGLLDPLVILCPYELMGSCQDEECNFQHQPNNSTT